MFIFISEWVCVADTVTATRTLIAEDEHLFRQIIRQRLLSHPDIDAVAEVGTGEDAIGLVEELQPDAVLMGIELDAGISRIEAGFSIKFARPEIGIVVLTSHVSKQFIVNSSGWSFLLRRNARDISSFARAIRVAS